MIEKPVLAFFVPINYSSRSYCQDEANNGLAFLQASIFGMAIQRSAVKNADIRFQSLSLHRMLAWFVFASLFIRVNDLAFSNAEKNNCTCYYQIRNTDGYRISDEILVVLEGVYEQTNGMKSRILPDLMTDRFLGRMLIPISCIIWP